MRRPLKIVRAKCVRVGYLWGAGAMQMHLKFYKISSKNNRKSPFGPARLLNSPSKAAKLTQKGDLGALKLAPGIPQDLPGRPFEHPWAPSRDPWDARIAPREALWEEKAAQGASKPGKTETSKTLEKPRFFNGFSWFFRVPGCCFSCLFRKNC